MNDFEQMLIENLCEDQKRDTIQLNRYLELTMELEKTIWERQKTIDRLRKETE